MVSYISSRNSVKVSTEMSFDEVVQTLRKVLYKTLNTEDFAIKGEGRKVVLSPYYDDMGDGSRAYMVGELDPDDLSLCEAFEEFFNS